MRASILASFALVLAPVAALAGSTEGTVVEPQPPGWEVPAGERGVAPNPPIVVPPAVDPDPAEDVPEIELESLERDDDDGEG